MTTSYQPSTDDRVYGVTYRETDGTTESDHDAVQSLPETATLETARENCLLYSVRAELTDDAGWSRGHVDTDGSYALT